ncbi:MAG TPA: 1,4-alpha-glucan branching protein GlgB [Pirellulaceae bacterium]|nr:1,4-alpha-glucan branching protein GlgB [Pirellulaceae bacterium]
MRTEVSLDNVGALVEGRLQDPGTLLGPHAVEMQGRKAVAVRAYFPNSSRVWLVDEAHKIRRPMRRIHPAGLYESVCPPPENDRPFQYQLTVADPLGETTTMHDPYNFDSLLTDFDFHLIGEGTHYDAYRKLGAQPRTVDGVTGVNFAVWAPNAQSVSVVGNFNGWDSRTHAMRKHIPCGIWEIFIPELGTGEIYKYKMQTATGEFIDKTDPYGFATELPPRTASVIADLMQYRWNDENWLKERRENDPLHRPISIYEVHLGSWRRRDDRLHGWLNYRELAHELVAYCQEMQFTHIELLPISEHPYTGSWGYQTLGYFAVTSRYGTPEDFMYFVDYCHQHNIGVILDWVPAHFPKDAHGLRQFDGTALYEHADPRQGEHPDWGTMIFNYGRNEVRNFLISNALFWLDRYHIDGLRVDAVASMLYLDYSRDDGQWVPNEYGGRECIAAVELLREFNRQTHAAYPGILTIAEESTSWGGVSHPTTTGGLGFSIKWNMGWMNDTLQFMKNDPVHRRYHHDELTFSLIYAFTENFALPLSHDEVVHGKRSLLDQMPGDLWQKFANLRLLYSYMWTHPGKKLLFMGSEFGQWNEWNCDASLQWDLLQWDTHGGIKQLITDLNRLYRREPAFFQHDFDAEGFEWIDCQNGDDSVLSYLRKANNPNDFLLVCCNFTPVVREGYRIGVPRDGWYDEIFNSDSQHYGGSNVGTHPGAEAIQPGAQTRPFALEITLPPLGVTVFKPR